MLEAGKKRASEARASSVIKSALACVRESPKDGARVPVHNLTKVVHGDGEQEDQKEKVHSKDRVQQSAQRLWREHAEVHPDKDDDGEDGEHANDDAGGAFGPVRGCEGLLVGNGMGRSGLTIGPLAGKLLAQLALGQAPDIDLLPYAPGI